MVASMELQKENMLVAAMEINKVKAMDKCLAVELVDRMEVD